MSSQRTKKISSRKTEQKAKAIGDYNLTSFALGNGQFGKVMLARVQDSKRASVPAHKQWMACKIINKASLNPRLQQNLKNEIGILSRIKNPNVIALYDI